MEKNPPETHPFPSPRVLPKMECFQMGKTLSQEQKDKLYQILLRNYVFVADSDKLPRCRFMEAEIQLEDENSAVFQPSYKFDEAEKVIADKLIEEKIEGDIIEECLPSIFCLPFLIVKKRVETPEISAKSAIGSQKILKNKDSTSQKTTEKMGKCYRFVLLATGLSSLCKSISWS